MALLNLPRYSDESSVALQMANERSFSSAIFSSLSYRLLNIELVPGSLGCIVAEDRIGQVSFIVVDNIMVSHSSFADNTMLPQLDEHCFIAAGSDPAKPTKR